MNNPFPDSNDPEALRALLTEIADYYMPFGMFGPTKYPPRGVVLYDLPLEYLGWFKAKGFPKGKLGQFLEVVWELKSNGLDALFDPFRKAQGGRRLGNKKKRSIKFDNE